MARHHEHNSKIAAAVRELVRTEEIHRKDLILIADKHDAPFKPVVKWLERLEVVAFGTYDEIMSRTGTVLNFREKVRLSIEENENG